MRVSSCKIMSAWEIALACEIVMSACGPMLASEVMPACGQKSYRRHRSVSLILLLKMIIRLTRMTVVMMMRRKSIGVTDLWRLYVFKRWSWWWWEWQRWWWWEEKLWASQTCGAYTWLYDNHDDGEHGVLVRWCWSWLRWEWQWWWCVNVSSMQDVWI